MTADAFRTGLYLEHLEEAAALWEQRDYDRTALAWPDLEDGDVRLEAHLDALVLGGDLALEACRRQSLSDDPGERYAALRVFCRQGRSDLVGVAMEATDPDDALALDALGESLSADLPTEWEAGAFRDLEDPRRLRLAADLAIDRRPERARALLGALGHAPPGLRAYVVRALGHIDAGLEADLVPLLEDDDPDVRLEAAVALARTGAADAALEAGRTDPALVPAFGIAGREGDVPWLHRVLTHHAAPAAARALGLLGYAQSVPPLLDALEAGTKEAAHALDLITGAGLEDEVAVEDVRALDERFPDERASEVEDGHRLDATERGLCTKHGPWRAWWDEHGRAFPAGRYRLGQPVTRASLVASLEAPQVPHGVRRWIADELAARHHMALPFRPTWEVARQRAALQAMRAWSMEA